MGPRIYFFRSVYIYGTYHQAGLPRLFPPAKRKLLGAAPISENSIGRTGGRIFCCCSTMQTPFKHDIGRVAPVTLRSRNVRVTAIADVLEKGTSGAKPDVPSGLNKYSSRITQPKSQGASQAMLFGTGLKEDDMNKPQARLACHPLCISYLSNGILYHIN